MKKSAFAWLSLSYLSLYISAQQEGRAVPAGATASAAGSYSCDPNTCQIANNCHCASKDPPSNLSPQDTP